MKRRFTRLLLPLILAMSLLPGLVGPVPSAAAAEVTDTQRAAAAAGLLSRYARGMDEPIYTSVTALYDHLMAFAGNGTATTPGAAGRAWYLLDALERRASLKEGTTNQSPVLIGGTSTSAVTGADEVTRTMVAAATYGQDLSTFAGRDFRTLLTGLRFNGADPGWYRTTAAGSIRVGTPIQTRAVLALVLTGQTDAAAEAAASLRGKQLASGAWGSTYTATTANFEATVLAVQALVAEGSEASITAAKAGAAYLKGLQQENGTFTGGTTIVLIGQAANALLAAGETASGNLAANYVRDLQVVGQAVADPLFDGGIATNADMRDRVANGTATPMTFSTLAANTLKGSLAWAPPLGSVHFAEPAERPAVEDNDTFKDGACVETEGVTVVLDYGYALEGTTMPDPSIIIRCALGTQGSGWIALENAGIAVASVPGFVGGALCQLNGYPAEGYPLCWYSPGGYWSYWHAQPGDKWNYSQLGASNRAPDRGSIEGWRFVPLDGAGVPPRVGPTFPESGYTDTTAPVMAFTSGPSGVTDQGVKIVFTWSLDDLGATLSCKLDDAEWGICGQLESWDASAQNMTLLDVPEGDHVFAVRAADTFGNTTTIERVFTVVPDVTPPTIAITTNPGTLTNVTSAAFRMTVGESDAAVSCRLDDGEWTACTTRTTQNYTGLTLGQHTFGYRATDLSGNTAEVFHTWTIAADAPPVVQISSGPSGYSGRPFSSTTASVTVNYTVLDAGTIASRECKLDDGEWAACYSATQARWTGLTLSQGLHTVSIRAVNGTGLASDVASYTWTVDSIKPVVSVTEQPPAGSAFNDAAVAWTVEDANEVYTQTCTLNGGLAVECTSPFVMKDLPIGVNTLAINARDVAYNWATTTTLTWEVLETVPPTLGELSVTDVTVTTAVAGIPVTAGNLDAEFVVELRRGDDKQATPPQQVTAGRTTTLSFALTGLAGYTDYEGRVVATDENGAVTRGAWLPFSTLGLAPGIGSASATELTTSSASIDVTATPGVPAAELVVEYRVGGGTFTTDGVVLEASEAEQPLTIGLTGLPANAKVAYRVVATNPVGTATGDWQEFTTKPVKPELITTSLTGLAARTATAAVTAVPGSLVASMAVEYQVGGETRTSKATSVPASLEPATVSFELTGLVPAGLVRYRAVIASDAGTITGDWQEFTTPQVGAPSISLAASTASGVIGQKVTLTWKVEEAAKVTAGGAWSGELATSGSKTVTLTKQGEHAFLLTASGPGGVSETVVRVAAKLPATELKVKPSSTKPVLAGKTVTLKLSGLAAGEPWTVTFAGQVRAQGKAGSKGTATAKVKVPASTSQGKLAFAATGSQPDRVGSASLWVAAKSAKLKVKAAHTKVRAGYKQKVTITGLVPGEKVTVTYRGKRISKKTAVANAKGVFTAKFKVGKSWGTKKVKVTGMASSRTGAVTFTVTPRNGSQGGAKGR